MLFRVMFESLSDENIEFLWTSVNIEGAKRFVRYTNRKTSEGTIIDAVLEVHFLEGIPFMDSFNILGHTIESLGRAGIKATSITLPS